MLTCDPLVPSPHGANRPARKHSYGLRLPLVQQNQYGVEPVATAGLPELSARWSTHLGVLLLHVCVGGIIYLMTLHLLSRDYLNDFRQAAVMLLKSS